MCSESTPLVPSCRMLLSALSILREIATCSLAQKKDFCNGAFPRLAYRCGSFQPSTLQFLRLSSLFVAVVLHCGLPKGVRDFVPVLLRHRLGVPHLFWLRWTARRSVPRRSLPRRCNLRTCSLPGTLLQTPSSTHVHGLLECNTRHKFHQCCRRVTVSHCVQPGVHRWPSHSTAIASRQQIVLRLRMYPPPTVARSSDTCFHQRLPYHGSRCD